MADRRVAERRSPLELLGEEAGHVVALGELEGHRVRLERLHDHEPRRIAAAAAGELGDELERPLLGPEVGDREAGVGIDDRREVDAGKVVALRDHLRADQHRAVHAAEALERLAQRAGPRRRVGVEPDPLELGHVPLELLLEPLGARADVRELDGAAARAGRRDGLAIAAVVAVEAAVAVQRQGDVAARRSGARARRPGSGAPA